MAPRLSGRMLGATFVTEVIYFYALREGKIAEFWLLSDQPFEYKQDPKLETQPTI